MRDSKRQLSVGNLKRKESAMHIQPGLSIGSKFKLLEKIGQGSFGEIYSCINMETNDKLAIKFEKRDPLKLRKCLSMREIKFLSELRGIKGFPQIYSYGRDNYHYYIMMTLLGKNFEEIFKKCQYRISLLSILHLAESIIVLIEKLHQQNIIHRDIKPENFAVDAQDPTKIYLIDFGLAKFYINENGNHIPFTQRNGLVGTARYASIAAQQGHEISRKDDLEAIGYLLVYLAKGRLPWQNLPCEGKQEKYKRILDSKINTRIEDLCEDLPSCFAEYMNYVKNLQFAQKPDYYYLKNLFTVHIDGIVQNQDILQFKYDWEAKRFLRCQNTLNSRDNNLSKIIHSITTKNNNNVVHTPQNQTTHEFFQSVLNTEENNTKRTSPLKAFENPSFINSSNSKINNYEISNSKNQLSEWTHNSNDTVQGAGISDKLMPFTVRRSPKSKTEIPFSVFKPSKFKNMITYGEYDDIDLKADEEKPSIVVKKFTLQKRKF